MYAAVFENGAHVYSNSWGGMTESSDILLNEIKEIHNSNGVFVVAAGNDNGIDLDHTPLYPAAFKVSNVVTVGASTISNGLASFSNVGRSTVHLAAPGEAIVSTTNNNGYGVMSGTSMATPIVAGAAAVLQSMALAAGTILTPTQIRQLLMQTVDPIPGTSKRLASGGRLNFGRAVSDLQAGLATFTGVSPPVAPTVDSPKNDTNLRFKGLYTIRSPTNTTHPYLAVLPDGSVGTQSTSQAWGRYHHAMGGSLFQGVDKRWLSTNGGRCSRLVMFTKRTTIFRRFNLRLLTAASTPKY